ncbi:EAL domain-containing protein [Sporosarcina sp. Marseille-Q4063]|uniref:sensor domain-containing protein n=1 Tax=Sporosarcina sp. Marseille-Q4063 TaxID=2810514 RepID=UPI001BB02AB9|nr:bifunctional diguanylate cyclase/phosphodiesterase [Sporosarcina sp. Marseille-Q4063]QUW21593.1 EAL domain-containing protein [Sporosarcina sp. Marseille-Q4063]
MLPVLNKRKKLEKYLEQEKYSYPEVFENSPDIILFIIDMDGLIVKIRGKHDQLFGMEYERIVGKKYSNFVFEPDLHKVQKYRFKGLKEGPQSFDFRIMNTNGNLINIDITLVPIKKNNEILGFYGLTHNVSEKVTLQNFIRKKSEKINSLIHHAHEIIGIINRDGVIVIENPSIEEKLGYKVEEISGRNILELIHPDDRGFFSVKFEEVIKRPNTPFTIELRIKHKKGEWRNFEVVCTNLLNNSNISGVICNFLDVTEIKNQQLEIQKMAYRDDLTGLPNLRAFEKRLDEVIHAAEHQKYAIIHLNLDGFRFLMDLIGREIANKLLVKIAAKIQSQLDSSINLLARINEDEFAILTTGIHETVIIEQIANDILQIFKRSFNVNSYNLVITIRMGISIYPESGKTSTILMKNASLALYLAKKESGGNYQIFSPSANVGTYKIFSLRNELQQALENNQFVIYYQPIINVSTKEIDSVEALLRWNHPDWGIVPPNEFIPFAEESGAIIQIGEWVLNNVCRRVSSWHKAGYPIRASVNLSIVQFLQPDLVKMIDCILEENDLDSKWLTIEITESTTIEQEEKMFDKLNQLRKLGVQIALDDFGTGYASFNKLIEIKPSILKLDSALIQGIPTEKVSTEIVTSIIQLAHRLSIKVVAEGVETVEQERFVADLACDWVQGYLYSKAVPPRKFFKMLEGQLGITSENNMNQEKSKNFIIEFQYPLEAMMTIAELNGRKVQLGNKKVLLENIEPDRLCFLSTVKLPVGTEMLLKFQMKIMGEQLTLFGKIVCGSEQEYIHQYEVKLIIEEKNRDFLIKQLDKLYLELNNESLITGHSFITESPSDYFKK